MGSTVPHTLARRLVGAAIGMALGTAGLVVSAQAASAWTTTKCCNGSATMTTTSTTCASGKPFTFSSDRTGDYEIYSQCADGSGLLQLTNSAGLDAYPSYNGSRTKIAFASTRAGGVFGIYVMN